MPNIPISNSLCPSKMGILRFEADPVSNSAAMVSGRPGCDIGSEDGGQPTFDASRGQSGAPRTAWAEEIIGSLGSF